MMTIIHDCLKPESSIANRNNTYVVTFSYALEDMAKMYGQLVKQQSTELKEIKDE
jgi:hypothetical protein